MSRSNLSERRYSRMQRMFTPKGELFTVVFDQLNGRLKRRVEIKIVNRKICMLSWGRTSHESKSNKWESCVCSIYQWLIGRDRSCVLIPTEAKTKQTSQKKNYLKKPNTHFVLMKLSATRAYLENYESIRELRKCFWNSNSLINLMAWRKNGNCNNK